MKPTAVSLISVLALGGCALAPVLIPAGVQLAEAAVDAYKTYEAARRVSVQAVQAEARLAPQVAVISRQADPLVSEIKQGKATPETVAQLNKASARLFTLASPFVNVVPNKNVHVQFHPVEGL